MAITAKFEAAGLRVIASRMVRLTEAQAQAFYVVHKERPFYAGLVKFMTEGPVVVQVLEGEGAIAKNREVMGATNPEKAARRHDPQGVRDRHRAQRRSRLRCARDCEGRDRVLLLDRRPRCPGPVTVTARERAVSGERQSRIVGVLVRTRMAFEQEQRAALRILEGIEEGSMSATESTALVEEADPALIYLIFTWLRKRYANHENSDAVIGRVVAISSRGSVAKMMKEGEADSVVQWFDETYSYRDLDKKAFIELVIEKLEG